MRPLEEVDFKIKEFKKVLEERRDSQSTYEVKISFDFALNILNLLEETINNRGTEDKLSYELLAKYEELHKI